jgi:hypothetical protein
VITDEWLVGEDFHRLHTGFVAQAEGEKQNNWEFLIKLMTEVTWKPPAELQSSKEDC